MACFSWLLLLAWLIVLSAAVSRSKTDETVRSAFGRIFHGLTGSIEDCSCEISTVDALNNDQIYPRLESLLNKNYFRFYRVNLLRECPFWRDSERCSQSTCRVRSSTGDEVPSAIRAETSEEPVPHTHGDTPTSDEQPECTHGDLGRLDTTLEQQRRADLRAQAERDSARGEFCQLDDTNADERSQLVFVDLLLNPERYTGYKGSSANRIWSAIYKENCLKLDHRNDPLQANAPASCLEERAFHKSVSGLHSSISVHLCAKSLLEQRCHSLSTIVPSSSVWGPNHTEFSRRFDPETTWGEGPQRLKNLYFVYLLELRAIQKVSPLLRQMPFVDNDDNLDGNTRAAVVDFLSVVDKFSDHFDETLMFQLRPDARLVFSQNFRNISRIMDCVSCDKCKLWGKLQTTGLGTALKILFSGHFDELQRQEQRLGRVPTSASTFLSRNEIVALFNAFGRLSSSVRSLEIFREPIKSPVNEHVEL